MCNMTNNITRLSRHAEYDKKYEKYERNMQEFMLNMQNIYKDMT